MNVNLRQTPLKRALKTAAQGMRVSNLVMRENTSAVFAFKHSHDCIDHLKLIDVFDALGVPSVCGRFYRHFLADREF